MESVDQGNHENDATCHQFVTSLSLPAEHSNEVEPLRKRTKLDEQNWFPIDKIPKVPEYIAIEQEEKPISRNWEYSSSSLNITYSSEKERDCSSVRQRYFSSSFQDNIDVQRSVRGLTTSFLEIPVFSTGIVSSSSQSQDNVDVQRSVRGLTTSFPETPVFSSGIVSSSFQENVDMQRPVRSLTPSFPETPGFSTGMVSSYGDKSRNIGKVLTPILYRNHTLHPPPNGKVCKPTMQRPLGCKTVAITGLRKALSHETLKEVFGYCGLICKLKRITGKSMFRVTYSCESAVDKVLELNGYTLVSSSGGKVLSGKIQVDYVAVRSEQHEYSSQMEVQQKEKNQKKPILLKPQCSKRNTSSQSPYLDPHMKFTQNAVAILNKKMCDNRLVHASKLFVRWIEEGECNESNSYHFFDILCAMQYSASTLMSDIAKLEESVQQQQSSLKAKYSSNLLYFEEILKAFTAATSETVFKDFSSKMKNKIDVWKKYIEDITESNSQNMHSIVMEEESNLQGNKSAAQNSLAKQQMTELQHLQAENERLKEELKLAQKEVSERYNDQAPQKLEETKHENQQTKNIENNNHGENVVKIVEKEAWLIAMIGTFLNFHRFGESIESIFKYLLKIDPMVTSQGIECLMRKLPTVFKEESVEGVDNSKTKWTVWGV